MNQIERLYKNPKLYIEAGEVKQDGWNMHAIKRPANKGRPMQAN